MKNFKTYLYASLVALLVWSCDEEDKLIDQELGANPDISVEAPSGTSGSLDLSKFVSIGASFTAGYMDRALYSHGQANSFPALMAQQFQAEGVGGGAFNQPDINSANGYSSTDGTNIFGKLVLDLDLNNDGVLGDAGIVASDGEAPTAFAGDKTALNNFGVPGIQTVQILIAETGGAGGESHPAYNPLYARFASSPGTSTILTDAIAQQPTFFSLWTGGNDVLGYATGGGTNPALLTDPAAFEGYFNNIIGALMANTTADGVVLNVPNVLALPFFQAVPYNAIPLTEQVIVDAANGAYAQYNGGVQAALANMIISAEEAALRTISFDIGANAIVIMDETLTDVETNSGGAIPIPKLRQLKTGELVLLSASTVLGTLADSADPTSIIGVAVPLDASYYLRGDQLVDIATNTAMINGSIAAAVAANSDRLLLFDANTLLLSIAAGGYSTPSYTLAYDFTPNGIFSNDGIHTNTRGNAILANEIMKAMDAKFGSDLPQLDVMQYNASPFQQ